MGVDRGGRAAARGRSRSTRATAATASRSARCGCAPRWCSRSSTSSRTCKVIDNLIEGPVRVKGVSRDEAIATAEKYLAKVGLSEKRDEYPARLSGGQKQRVAIARALTMEPKVLLFDEPTSALDPTLVGEVLNVMEELAHEGATMIVVTHEMAFAREAADRVYFIEEGVFLEVGPPDQVIDNPQDPRTRDFLARTLGAAHVHEGGAVHVPDDRRAPPRGRGSGARARARRRPPVRRALRHGAHRGARPPLAIGPPGGRRLAGRRAVPVRPGLRARVSSPAWPSSPAPTSSTSPTSPASA